MSTMTSAKKKTRKGYTKRPPTRHEIDLSRRPIERDRSWNSVANILHKSNPISCCIQRLMNNSLRT